MLGRTSKKKQTNKQTKLQNPCSAANRQCWWLEISFHVQFVLSPKGIVLSEVPLIHCWPAGQVQENFVNRIPSFHWDFNSFTAATQIQQHVQYVRPPSPLVCQIELSFSDLPATSEFNFPNGAIIKVDYFESLNWGS